MEKFIGEIVDDILLMWYWINDIFRINVVREGDVWVLVDNRRLGIFKILELLG